MKKSICGLLVCVLLCSFFASMALANASSEPSRMINVVYDDSGSMYRTDSVVDTWC